MKVYFDKKNKSFVVKSKDVKSMLRELKIPANTVIVSANGELVDGDYKFKAKDEVKILSVVSGG